MYLTEEKLISVYGEFHRDHEIVCNKNFLKVNRIRPDICDLTSKTVIEFDGFLHYTNPNTIVSDLIKDKIYATAGFTVVRIPYFIQLCKQSLLMLNIGDNIEQTYKHGFIDNKVILPAAFCSLGIERFMDDMRKFSFAEQDIKNSLRIKNRLLGDKRLVIPDALNGWLFGF